MANRRGQRIGGIGRGNARQRQQPADHRLHLGLMRAAAADPSLRPRALAQIAQTQDKLVEGITQQFVSEGRPATFRVIVDPLVSWMWIGAIIAIAGALIAVWPTPGARRRRVSAAQAARLGRELSRA